MGGANIGRTSSITMPSIVGILGRAPAVDKKSVMFFCLFFVCFLSCFGMTKFVITETIWSSITFKTIWCHCIEEGLQLCTYVQVFLSTPIIFPEGQIFSKIYHIWRFLVPYGHSFKATTLKFRMTVRSRVSLPHAKYCKNRVSWYTPLGQIYNQNYYFWQVFGP